MGCVVRNKNLILCEGTTGGVIVGSPVHFRIENISVPHLCRMVYKDCSSGMELD